MTKKQKRGTTETGRYLPIAVRSCGLLGPPQPQNHKGLGVGLLAAHGRSATSFVAPINAPPKVSKIKRGTGVWAT